jgi:uncharacterized membrane protein HdeD (DUF308 family)
MLFTSRRALITRGLIAMIFGLTLLMWPVLSFDVFVLLFGVFALVDGILIVVAALRVPRSEPWRLLTLLAGGAGGLVLGIATFVWPNMTVLLLVVLIALRSLIVGVAEVATSVWMCRHVVNARPAAWIVGTLGAVSIAFACFLLASPVAGVVALMWVTGLYAVVIGLMTTARAWAMGGVSRQVPLPAHHRAA